jgi:ABC-type dipeptide/oligopeptide/nickel transport system permease subunit
VLPNALSPLVVQGTLEIGVAIIEPGPAIMLNSLAFNLMGDGLHDALDPHLKEWAPGRRRWPPGTVGRSAELP